MSFVKVVKNRAYFNPKFKRRRQGKTDYFAMFFCMGKMQKKAFRTITNCNNDFARLGRILTGNAVGLVLGGGGARGAAHVGIIEALRECNVPIDIVGGTSIGSWFFLLINGLLYWCYPPNASHYEKFRPATMTDFWLNEYPDGPIFVEVIQLQLWEEFFKSLGRDFVVFLLLHNSFKSQQKHFLNFGTFGRFSISGAFMPELRQVKR